ncbi:MAG: LysR family transcriptional regulator [Opitutus sp.]|nr:LysR family transcriptional regulator [Opitutus sp.]MCS6247459.1 LysR family transcriptional regulator [Opitutus sp.]MCS6274052.1 LysR family transcriptional regulator [Opitutus sp.]MCS6279101.1 LysR family transcriptional regulator [Opitutus sp.]MCS6298564.1 LysR family transcriptional regulator [Opitutus sp.]
MDWLNYHHLRYFWIVAKEGGLRQAAEKLNISQPSISAQISELEAALGEKLFRRKGRANVLTDAGQTALRYADEIFNLGRELTNAIKQGPTTQTLRLHVGIADALPKLITHEILKPVFAMSRQVHVICREGKTEDLLGHLAAHRLDIVLADEPASGVSTSKVFNHHLGESSVTFCAAPELAAALKPGFPKSLHGAPALLAGESTALRRSLEKWFRAIGVRPQVLADFDDGALMKVIASDGRGFVAIPSVIVAEAKTRYGLVAIGTTLRCVDNVYAITAERRLSHPAVNLITESARRLFSQ